MSKAMDLCPWHSLFLLFPYYAETADLLENFSGLLKLSYGTTSKTLPCRARKQYNKMQHMLRTSNQYRTLSLTAKMQMQKI